MTRKDKTLAARDRRRARQVWDSIPDMATVSLIVSRYAAALKREREEASKEKA